MCLLSMMMRAKERLGTDFSTQLSAGPEEGVQEDSIVFTGRGKIPREGKKEQKTGALFATACFVVVLVLRNDLNSICSLGLNVLGKLLCNLVKYGIYVFSSFC